MEEVSVDGEGLRSRVKAGVSEEASRASRPFPGCAESDSRSSSSSSRIAGSRSFASSSCCSGEEPSSAEDDFPDLDPLRPVFWLDERSG